MSIAGKILYFFITFPCRLMNMIGWWRWRVEGIENLPPVEQGGMVIATNHMNWQDIIIMGAMIPYTHRLSWLGKTELFESRFGHWFFHTMQVIPVNRGRGDLAAMETCEKALRGGARLLIFPEGQRSKTASLQEGRGGAIRLAMRSDVPIVPVAIAGSEHGLKGTMRRQKITIRIGTPYKLEPTPNKKIPPRLMDHLVTDLMQRIAAMLPESYHGYYRASSQRNPSVSATALQPEPVSPSTRHHV